jgi:uncharacterized protein YcbX
MQVAQLWQYAVKSMIGTQVPASAVTESGMVGDRGWAVRDEERGGIRGAKKIGSLMRLAAHYEGDPSDPFGRVVIELPDGTSVASDDPDVDQRLSAALEHRVSLWPLQPAGDLEHYRRGRPDSDDIMVELRSVFGREGDEPLPDLSVFPPVIMEFESPPGTYLDAFPLLVMTTSALRSLSLALEDSVVDVRRFRPNIVIDTGDEPGHPEFSWVGRTMVIGDGGLELELIAPCPRCVMVTREVAPDLPLDRRVLRHIVRDLDQNVGLYATARFAGAISVGDKVTVREQPA